MTTLDDQSPSHRPNGRAIEGSRRPLTALFIGGQSLLLQCAELWLAQGHRIVGIVSDTLSIQQWAASKTLPTYANQDIETQCLSKAFGLSKEFDYLFSLANLNVTPAALVQSASQYAINFHDGLLPYYAGLNVTNWALLNDEKQHGITWHLMAPQVDRGDIVYQESFPIELDETVFTLNAKCFAAALATFPTILEQINRGDIRPKPQTQPIERYYLRQQRPAGVAVIDWQQTPIQLNRLSRSLYYNGYANPLTCVKFNYANQWYSCEHLEPVAPVEGERLPIEPVGTVLHVGADSIDVRVGDGVIRVSKITALEGKASVDLRDDFKVGTQCVLFSKITLAAMLTISEMLAPDERYWVEALRQVEPMELPFAVHRPALTSRSPNRSPNRSSNMIIHTQSFDENALISCVVLDAEQNGVGDGLTEAETAAKKVKARTLRLASILCLFLARFANTTQVTLPLNVSQHLEKKISALLSDSNIATENGNITALFGRLVPLTFSYDPNASIASALVNVEATLSHCLEKLTFARDLFKRIPTTELTTAWLDVEHDLAVVIDDGQGDDAQSSQSKIVPESHIAIIVRDQTLQWIVNTDYFDETSVLRLQALLEVFAQQIFTEQHLGQWQSKPVADIRLFLERDQQLLAQVNDTSCQYPKADSLVVQFEKQVQLSPERTALIFRHHPMSFAELNAKVNQLARLLRTQGVDKGDRVGVLLPRSHEMVVTLLATLKLGAAYVPLDPSYPVGRLNYMMSDADLTAVVTDGYVDDSTTGLQFQAIRVIALNVHSLQAYSEENVGDPIDASHLAYMIYTSGSTGRPKGVMVAHYNVLNFFTGMDALLLDSKTRQSLSDNVCFEQNPLTWLAVTSISFDISVLELLWTLTRGMTILLYRDPLLDVRRVNPVLPDIKAVNENIHKSAKKIMNRSVNKREADTIQFGLFFWNHIREDQASVVPTTTDEAMTASTKFDLLFKASEMADQNGFSSIWTPERHFGEFGGDYPNPSVISAALAVKTDHIQIRAGSCVLPLHHPARVVEEWSVVDHLSSGRVGISFASGWQPNDFIFNPEHHRDAKQVMLNNIETVRQLWRGESVNFSGPKGEVSIQTQPRPIQSELPCWLTAAGNPETFQLAGERGYNILTHLLGQSIEGVAENIALYKAAWQAAGHAGEGHVTLMLHTLVGKEGLETDEEESRIRTLARQPMKSYLRSAMFLVKQAAWHFPTFSSLSEDTGRTIDELFDQADEQMLDDLLEFAFMRYYAESGLFGTFGRCLARVQQLVAIGVDEIGCLVDYGLESEAVLAHLPHLIQLKTVSNTETIHDPSISELAEHYKITHLQCTPSQSSLILADRTNHVLFKQIQHLLQGGEALTPHLASELRSLVPGKITHVYGPTETTIWSTAYSLPTGIAFEAAFAAPIPIGQPLANTRLYVVDQRLRLLPMGVIGELLIAGEGVTQGYYQQPGLTAERFVHCEFEPDTLYRTGDLARWREDGQLEYVGRADSQVKIRGYRIELGEIESCLFRLEEVKSVVVTTEKREGDTKIVAYIVSTSQGQSAQRVDHEKCLKEALAKMLPQFMVPNQFYFLKQMPLTPNGKIDRKQLSNLRKSLSSLHKSLPNQNEQRESAASHSHSGSGAQCISSNDIERQVLEVWQAAIGQGIHSVQDNFFDIGGHSLLAIKVLADLRKVFSKTLQITDIFRYPTVQSFAAFLSKNASDSVDLQQSESRVNARREALARRRRRR